MKFIIPVVILVAGFIAMKVLLGFRTDPPRRVSDPAPKIVETTVIKLGPVRSSITALGRVKTVQPVELFSEVSGNLLEGDIPFQPAQSFSEGDLLIKIDDRQTKLQINSAKSDLLTALATALPEIKLESPSEYKIWQEYFDRFDFDRTMDELPQTTNPKIKLFISRFGVYKLYFTIRDLEIKLEKHYFRAPFKGSIVSTNLSVGSTARNGTLLGEIFNLDDLEIEMPIPVSDIRWIDPGGSVELTASVLNDVGRGKIKRIGETIDTRTQTVQVFVSIEEPFPPGLLAGQFFEARIPGRTIEDAISIPGKAVYGEKYVYLVQNGRLDYREVSIARRETDSVIINDGLADGDTLVVELLQGVAAGMPAMAKDRSP